jgi:hypothetical protein
MDTVGDAYVVIGLCDDEESLKGICRHMLTLARSMVVTLQDFGNVIQLEVCVGSRVCRYTDSHAHA